METCILSLLCTHARPCGLTISVNTQLFLSLVSDVPVAIVPIVAIVGGLCRSFLLGTSGMNLNLVELDVLHVEAYQIKEVLKVIFPSTLVRPCR